MLKVMDGRLNENKSDHPTNQRHEESRERQSQSVNKLKWHKSKWLELNSASSVRRGTKKKHKAPKNPMDKNSTDKMMDK